MILLIKILVILAVLFFLAYPLIPAQGKLKRLFPASGLRYDPPHNKKNFFFIILALVEFIVVAILFGLFDDLTVLVQSVPFVGSLFTGLLGQFNSQIDFIFFTIRFILVNLILLYLFLFVKAFLKKAILDPLFGLSKKRKKKKKKKKKEKKNAKNDSKENNEEENSPGEEDSEEQKKNRRVPCFLHSDAEDEEPEVKEDHNTEDASTDTEEDSSLDKGEKAEDPKPDDPSTHAELPEASSAKRYGPIASFLFGLFFEGDNFETARAWVIRVRTILQCFVVLIEILYLIFILGVLISTFFPLPLSVYSFLLDTFHLGDWYLYPILSVLFLQEICNTCRTPSFRSYRKYEKSEKEERKEVRKVEARLRKLLSLLKRHFDAEHSLRYYPEAPQEDIKEYEPSSVAYRSALRFIRDHMKAYTGRVVQSYMQCLDASFSDDHVYFASSFYSELGSYLVAYTYIRLLSGARVIFVVSSPEERAPLRAYLSERLIKLTNSSATNSWRIYTADERLDQADILIASPGDFRDGNVVAQYPGFFEEVSNAIFLDTDHMISLDSYLCPVMATRLRKVTENRIRFLFLTQDLYKGFAARTLPKFFCVEPILTFSSAKENESVSYVLWNRESKSHRIYNENGQKTTCLEYMIADLACQHDVDGVRVMTESPLDHAERKLLTNYGVEINKLYRDLVDINYMVYSDERCNLSASIYSCTRFRGQKKSVVHILSKPYLLREYFISKAATENFVNRSSFIQPRVPEHIDEHKLSLLRLFCEVASEEGVLVSVFENRVRDIITVSRECGYIIASAFCRKMLQSRAVTELSTAELAAYFIAGLCDTDLGNNASSDTAAAASYGHRAKEFYLIFDPSHHDGYNTHREKYIVFNREREVFNCLFACNDRVALCLNDVIIGYEDTFPIRSHLEFVAGQSIHYQNSEYEIEHISEDGRTLYLRSENVKLSHCLDTIHLRRYAIDSLTPIPQRTGVLNNTKLTLEEIRVTECVASFKGETYGFYGLSRDKQTLDFYHKDGVDGNPHIANPHVRPITDGRILKVELLARMTCNDGMRLLLAAVFNEFIRTIFPKTYHAISIVPVLEQPLPFDSEVEPKTEIERIQALYPYLLHPSDSFIETEPNRLTFLFINDCFEDVGAFQWFYDLSGRYMQEFLANIYAYLHWLKLRSKKNHYIYFGGERLPACYDLEGCCQLLDGFNRILAELDGDFDMASDDLDDVERCAFCHREMETGRYSLFDNHRYICADCFDVVDDPTRLEELHGEMCEYLSLKYPKISFGNSKAAMDPVYDLKADQVFSEFYYRVDQTERTIFTERDDPVENVRISLLRGRIALWQADHELINEYAKPQLYYEELCYLREKKLNESADWIYQNLSPDIIDKLEEIAAYTGISVAPVAPTEEITEGNPDTEQPNEVPNPNVQDGPSDGSDNPESEESEQEEQNNDTVEPEGRTSFDFMLDRCIEDEEEEKEGDFFADDDQVGLYDPNKIPRFWKRYLRNQSIDDGKNEDLSNAENDPADEESEVADKTSGNDSDQKKKKKFSLFKRLTHGEKICPVEEDEATNPKIRVYNEILRHAYNYSEEPFDRSGVSDKEFVRILYHVLGDYPEIFWVCGYSDGNPCRIAFRCKDKNGKFDRAQVDRKRKELRQAAKKFTRGITRKTPPMEAVLTIYRRLLLRCEYDFQGLASGINRDISRDDPLRSLHSALVNHKIVCAGYAVAMQYLLQSVGIVTAYTISEGIPNAKGELDTHAFNILKIDKKCYYLDATWGDPSEPENRDLVNYGYLCVPYDEFKQTSADSSIFHEPSKEYYPNLEQFRYTEHEYYRYHNAYLHSYNEKEIVRIIAEATKSYDRKEMGRFVVSIRFPTQSITKEAANMLQGNLGRLVALAKVSLKKKEHISLLQGTPCYSYPTNPEDSGIISIYFK